MEVASTAKAGARERNVTTCKRKPHEWPVFSVRTSESKSGGGARLAEAAKLCATLKTERGLLVSNSARSDWGQMAAVAAQGEKSGSRTPEFEVLCNYWAVGAAIVFQCISQAHSERVWS